jgi:squalene cyclase
MLGENQSGVVQTSWALLGLMAGNCKDKDAVHRGVQFLMRKQKADGDWDQEGITGVFNRSCGITYTAYRNVFTMWALARYSNWAEK